MSSLIHKTRAKVGRLISGVPASSFIETLPAESRDIVTRVQPFSMTSPERLAAFVDAMRYVDRRGLAGAVVECGVWKGGSSMAGMLASDKSRDFYMYDTYDGMSLPTEADVDKDGLSAASLLATADKQDLIWARSEYGDVVENVRSTGYPMDRVHFVQGKVEETIPGVMPDQIAILRLDTDWYESTRHELNHLFPKLVTGGVLIIDDYGHWDGARRAVDEYFSADPILLNRIDYTGRIAIKV